MPKGNLNRGVTEKERHIKDLFARVAPRYDLMNVLMSFGRHRAWKRTAARLAGLSPGDIILDVCCGTGDLSRAAREIVGERGLVVGMDLCEAMLEIALKRAPELRGGLVIARAEALPFRTGCAGAALSGFSLRNVSDLRMAISEMARAVGPGGKVVLLETSRPRSRFVLPFWRFYMSRIIPALARLCRAPADAYEYFQRSAQGFLSREDLAAGMAICGLRYIAVRDLALGAVCVHIGTKECPES